MIITCFSTVQLDGYTRTQLQTLATQNQICLALRCNVTNSLLYCLFIRDLYFAVSSYAAAYDH